MGYIENITLLVISLDTAERGMPREKSDDGSNEASEEPYIKVCVVVMGVVCVGAACAKIFQAPKLS